MSVSHASPRLFKDFRAIESYGYLSPKKKLFMMFKFIFHTFPFFSNYLSGCLFTGSIVNSICNRNVGQLWDSFLSELLPPRYTSMLSDSYVSLPSKTVCWWLLGGLSWSTSGIQVEPRQWSLEQEQMERHCEGWVNLVSFVMTSKQSWVLETLAKFQSRVLKILQEMNIHLENKFLSPPMHHTHIVKYLNFSYKCAYCII